MPKFIVHVDRSVLVWETALVAVEAENIQVAITVTQQRLDDGDLDSDELDWTSDYSETRDFPEVRDVADA